VRQSPGASGLEVRLHHPLRIRERALGLGDLRRGKKEDLRLDVRRLHVSAHHFRCGLPELRRLVQPVVLDDEPLELTHARAFELRVQ